MKTCYRAYESLTDRIARIAATPTRYNAGERNIALGLFTAAFIAVVALQGLM